jgi:hypothetical protein
MQETLRHLDLAIEALRRNCPAHMMLRELEQCQDQPREARQGPVHHPGHVRGVAGGSLD